MAEMAALITAIASLIAAVAWPVAITAVFLLYRKQFSIAADKLPAMIGRMQKVKLGAFEAELEKEVEDLVEQAVIDPGKISPEQIRSSARIQIAAKSLDQQTLRDQVQQLCIEYETIRKVLPAGVERTRAMTEVLVRMRTIGPAISYMLEELKNSSSAGYRLAAIAIMQVKPDTIDLGWLLDRFRKDAAFIFYHAALVLQNAAALNSPVGGPSARKTAADALKVVEAFQGVPDQNTVSILRRIIGDSRGDT